MSSYHRCPAPGCAVDVPHHLLACRAHWFTIPKPLRDDLWRAYQNHGPGSDEHAEALRRCVEQLEAA